MVSVETTTLSDSSAWSTRDRYPTWITPVVPLHHKMLFFSAYLLLLLSSGGDEKLRGVTQSHGHLLWGLRAFDIGAALFFLANDRHRPSHRSC